MFHKKGLLYSDCGYNCIADFSDADWVGCPIDRRSTIGYCVFIRGSWKRKNRSLSLHQDDLTREFVWIQDILTEWGFVSKTPKRLYYDNLAANYIIQNSLFHERMKHIEVDCHVVRRKYDVDIIELKHVSSANQLANLLAKPLRRSRVQFICNKLEMYDVYAPA